MKNRKLLGTTLIASAVLLQVGYAAVVIDEHKIVNTSGFQVYVQDSVITKASEAVQVNVIENGSGLDIQVGNLYPGANFEIEMNVENFGDITAQIKGIQLEVLEKQEVDKGKIYNQDLMDFLVGYDEDNNPCVGENSYREYLIKTYVGRELEKGEFIPLKFKLGMNPEIEYLQNQQVDFKIQIDLEQVIQSGGGSSNDSNNDNPSDGGVSVVPPGPTPTPTTPDEGTEVLDEEIPGGPVEGIEIPDEGIPGGGVNIPEDEKVEGGFLPKTGGVASTFVYTIGFVLLAGGIVICSKKENKE